MIWGVVTVRDVVVAPAKLPGIKRENARREPRVYGTLEQGYRQLIIMRQVKLEETRTITIRLAHILNRRAACCTQAVRQVQLSCHFSNWNLRARVVDPVDANRSKPDRRSYLVAEDSGGSVAFVSVNEHTGNDPVAVEGLAVGCMCGRLASIRGGVVPAA